MVSPTVRTPREMGARIGQAREDAGLTQAALAAEVGIDRTSVVRLEAGERKVSAGELAVIAHAVGRPIDWFVVESPPAVLSRRRDPGGAHETSRELDVEVDRAARDVQFLLDRKILAWVKDRPARLPRSHDEAEALAARTRRRLGLADEPLLELGDAADQLGLVAFVLDLGGISDGACFELSGSGNERRGVAVIDGGTDPGRRRWTLAHELGHFLVGDAYAGDHPAGDIERYVGSFVAYLLMPRQGVLRLWHEVASRGERTVALALSARYRTSWSAACNQLLNVDLVDSTTWQRLSDEQPTWGDYAALGEDWTDLLRPPFVPREYTRQVLSAYVEGQLSSARTVELIRSTLSEGDLPSPQRRPIDALRSAFDPLA